MSEQHPLSIHINDWALQKESVLRIDEIALELDRLQTTNSDLLAALKDIAEKWPAAFAALGPGLKHMTSAQEIRSVNDFDQAVVQARGVIAKAEKQSARGQS